MTCKLEKEVRLRSFSLDVTRPYGGRDFRLTDVPGRVLHDIFA